MDHLLRRLVPAALAGAGTACTGLATAFHSGIFAGLSVLSWISAVWLTGRLNA